MLFELLCDQILYMYISKNEVKERLVGYGIVPCRKCHKMINEYGVRLKKYLLASKTKLWVATFKTY